MTEYKNPTPVVVLCVPINMGANTIRLLTIRRNIEPALGMLALPGGYVDENENAETAAARELKEETGIDVDPAHVGILYTRVTPNNKLLIFCDTPDFAIDEIQNELTLNNEVSEFRFVSQGSDKIAFPLHNEAIDWYFANR